MRSKKYLMYGILVVLVISIGVTFAYFQTSVENKNGKLSINSKEINIIFTDTTEISEEGITPGWSTSKSFSVENKSGDVFNYNIVLEDLINTFETVGNLQYKITSTNGYNMTEYADIPKSKEAKDVILAYDIDIEASVKQEYTIEFIYKNSTEDQSIDMTKEFSGILAITEGSIDPNKKYSVTIELENGTITSENPQESLKKGSLTYTYELNEGYEINDTEVICSGSAKGEITEDNIIIRDIREDQICTIRPSKKRYTINIGTNDANMGTVSPSSSIIEHGGSASITINPKTGHRYVSNTCGGTLSGNTMTISNITANKSCTVTFGLDTSLFYSKLLADNPTRTGQRPGAFSSIYTSDNTGVMYVASGNQTEDGSNVYYFAGNALNNWVKFGQDSSGSDLYWRIIRTNEDGSVRMLYSGTSPDTTAGYINASQAYNVTYNNPMYVGYMYGSSGSLANNRTNTTNSSIKTTIDNWYANGLNTRLDASGNTFDAYISQTAIYCNDRAHEGTYSIDNAFYYATYKRLLDAKSPSYKCGNNASGSLYSTASNADKFSKSTGEGGNGKLTYPISLITADEISFAGGLNGFNVPAWYYYNSKTESIIGNSWWWTMSPYIFRDSGTSVFIVGGSNYPGRLTNAGLVSNTVGVRPVISIKLCATWKSGNGSSSTPYEVNIDSACASAVN